MSEAMLLACVFWYLNANKMSSLSLFRGETPSLEMNAWTLFEGPSKTRRRYGTTEGPYLQIRPSSCRKTLLHFTQLQKLVLIHKPAELPYERDVLAHVPTELPELWILLHEPFHIRYRID